MLDAKRQRAVRKFFRDLKGYELSVSVDEMEKWHKTGDLKKDGMIRELHQRHQEVLGVKLDDIYVTERALLIEISKRYRDILKSNSKSKGSEF